MDISIDKATIISICLESLLYGVFCVTFAACLYILVYKRLTARVNIPMLLTAVLLWIFATIHVAVDLRRMLDAFYTFRNAPGGPVAYLNQIDRVTHVLKSAVYITQTCISDALVVYRCHAVMRNYTVTLLLSATVVGSAVAGYGSIYMLVHIPPFNGSIFNTGLAPWITSFNVITAGTNILATALLAWNIWCVNRRVSNLLGANGLSPVILILVESGAIYAFTLLLLTALYTSDSNAQFIVLDAVSPIIGIVFSLIIIRVGLRRETGSQQPSTWLVNSKLPSLPFSLSGAPHQAVDAFSAENTIALAPIAVNVTTSVEDDYGDQKSKETAACENELGASMWDAVV